MSATGAHGFHSARITRRWTTLLLAVVIFNSLATCLGQKADRTPVPSLDPVEGEKVAKELVDKMLAQKPKETSVQTGQIKIFEGKGKWREIPLKIEIRNTATNVLTTYETSNREGHPDTRLLIGHSGTSPNTYLLQKYDAQSGLVEKNLKDNATLAPFAGSDFWIADLGLEFLHWPKQRVLKKVMRRSQFCAVLESTNPDPKAGYSRVLCWIDMDPPYGIVHAEAYDSKNDLLKNFDPTEIKKVEGQYELAEMEIRNRQTGSRTKIDFNVE